MTEYNGSEGQHPDIVQLVAGKVIAVDLSLWVFQARLEPNLRQNFTSESAACAKVAFERVRLQKVHALPKKLTAGVPRLCQLPKRRAVCHTAWVPAGGAVAQVWLHSSCCIGRPSSRGEAPDAAEKVRLLFRYPGRLGVLPTLQDKSCPGPSSISPQGKTRLHSRTAAPSCCMHAWSSGQQRPRSSLIKEGTR